MAPIERYYRYTSTMDDGEPVVKSYHYKTTLMDEPVVRSRRVVTTRSGGEPTTSSYYHYKTASSSDNDPILTRRTYNYRTSSEGRDIPATISRRVFEDSRTSQSRFDDDWSRTLERLDGHRRPREHEIRDKFDSAVRRVHQATDIPVDYTKGISVDRSRHNVPLDTGDVLGCIDGQVTQDDFHYKLTLDMRDFVEGDINVKALGQAIVVEADLDGAKSVAKTYKRRFILPENVPVNSLKCSLTQAGKLDIQGTKKERNPLSQIPKTSQPLARWRAYRRWY